MRRWRRGSTQTATGCPPGGWCGGRRGWMGGRGAEAVSVRVVGWHRCWARSGPAKQGEGQPAAGHGVCLSSATFMPAAAPHAHQHDQHDDGHVAALRRHQLHSHRCWRAQDGQHCRACWVRAGRKRGRRRQNLRVASCAMHTSACYAPTRATVTASQWFLTAAKRPVPVPFAAAGCSTTTVGMALAITVPSARGKAKTLAGATFADVGKLSRRGERGGEDCARSPGRK